MNSLQALTIVLALSAAVPIRSAADNGATLYAQKCASCHGSNGQGTANGPSLVDDPASLVHFMLDTGRMPATVPYANGIHRPAQFGQRDIARIVAFVESFSGHPNVALPMVVGGDARSGRTLFMENCAQCHGPAGAGGSVGSQNVAPSLMGASVFQVGEAIRSGPGVMPRFGADVLSDEELDDIARYVNVLQTQTASRHGIRAAGWTLGGVGPVAEGFVAWFFGLGILVLFIRWIGTTD